MQNTKCLCGEHKLYNCACSTQNYDRIHANVLSDCLRAVSIQLQQIRSVKRKRMLLKKGDTSRDFAASHVCNSAGENKRKHLRINPYRTNVENRVSS